MEDLVDKATVSYAELENGDWVGVILVVGAPLDVEADDQAVEAVVVDVFCFGDPVCDGVRVVGYGCGYGVGIEGYCVGFFGVGGFEFFDAGCHGYQWSCLLDLVTESGKSEELCEVIIEIQYNYWLLKQQE